MIGHQLKMEERLKGIKLNI